MAVRRKYAAAAFALAAIVLLLAGVRIPQEKPSMTLQAQGAPVEAAPIPFKQGDVPVNLADAAALKTLPMIGDVLSETIIRERTVNGPFLYPEDLLAVRGIGEKTLAAIYPLVDLSQEAP